MMFRDPRWLWLLAAIPFAALFLAARERLRGRLARRFVAVRLRGISNPARRFRPWLLTAGLAFAAFALAGPSRGFVTIPLTTREANRVVVLDVSHSMLAQDVGTSRLAASKAIASALIGSFPGRTGLVVFEQRPDVIAPLTTDNDAVNVLLESVQAGEVGEPGSDLGAAITSALRLVENEPGAKADVIVISDGEDQGTKLDDALRHAKQRGVPVSAIVIGSGEGSAIPLPDGSSLRDGSGRIVTTWAHRETMEHLARATSGVFLENPFAEHALDPLMTARGGAAKERNVRIPVDRYQWPLSIAFAALLLGSLAHRGAE